MINDFIYTQPVKIWFGAGSFGRLAEVLESLKATRAVVVCDPFLRGKISSFAENNPGIVDIFSDVEPNPQLSGAAAVAELIRENDADACVGIGGGSTMDTAKFAAAIALGEGSADEYFTGERAFPEERVPVITVPQRRAPAARSHRSP